MRMTSPGHRLEQNRAVRSASRMEALQMVLISDSPQPQTSGMAPPRLIAISLEEAPAAAAACEQSAALGTHP